MESGTGSIGRRIALLENQASSNKQCDLCNDVLERLDTRLEDHFPLTLQEKEYHGVQVLNKKIKEAKALRKMRHPTRLRHLEGFIEANQS